MTREEAIAAVGRMNEEEVGLLKQLLYGETPIEAVRLLEFFHYFPGCRLVKDEPLVTAPSFEEDTLETQTRLEVWQGERNPYDIPY